MILPTLIIPELSNQKYNEMGKDSLGPDTDKKYFNNYPDEVTYEFNSRGFRDKEWPNDSELKQSIWCIGDSYTLGLGQSFKYIWPQVLQQETGIRTISVSMNGASNNWISRKTVELLKTICPKNIVVMWSFANRREKDDTLLSDYDRRIWYLEQANIVDDLNDFNNCVKNVLNSCQNSNLVQLTIPKFGPRLIRKSVTENNIPNFLGAPHVLDLARDKFHFGNQTARNVALKIIPLLTT